MDFRSDDTCAGCTQLTPIASSRGAPISQHSFAASIIAAPSAMCSSSCHTAINAIIYSSLCTRERALATFDCQSARHSAICDALIQTFTLQEKDNHDRKCGNSARSNCKTDFASSSEGIVSTASIWTPASSRALMRGRCQSMSFSCVSSGIPA
jgi:hypothetical protein